MNGKRYILNNSKIEVLNGVSFVNQIDCAVKYKPSGMMLPIKGSIVTLEEGEDDIDAGRIFGVFVGHQLVGLNCPTVAQREKIQPHLDAIARILEFQD